MASLWPELTECTSQGCSVSRIWIICVRSATDGEQVRSVWLTVPHFTSPCVRLLLYAANPVGRVIQSDHNAPFRARAGRTVARV